MTNSRNQEHHFKIRSNQVEFCCQQRPTLKVVAYFSERSCPTCARPESQLLIELIEILQLSGGKLHTIRTFNIAMDLTRLMGEWVDIHIPQRLVESALTAIQEYSG